LIRFRFSEKIIESLEDIAWWDQPDLLNWLKVINPYFLVDFTKDEGKALALLQQVKEHKLSWLRRFKTVPENVAEESVSSLLS
jgi:nicotinic acid phosphoribosyltransferase